MCADAIHISTGRVAVFVRMGFGERRVTMHVLQDHLVCCAMGMGCVRRLQGACVTSGRIGRIQRVVVIASRGIMASFAIDHVHAQCTVRALRGFLGMGRARVIADG